MSAQRCNSKIAAFAPDKMLQITLPVLKQSKRIRGRKSDSYEDGEPDPIILLTFNTFQTPRGSEGPVERMASAIPASPVIVDVCQIPRGSKGPKATTVKRIATPTPIPVAVDTFQNPASNL